MYLREPTSKGKEGKEKGKGEEEQKREGEGKERKWRGNDLMPLMSQNLTTVAMPLQRSYQKAPTITPCVAALTLTFHKVVWRHA